MCRIPLRYSLLLRRIFSVAWSPGHDGRRGHPLPQQQGRSPVSAPTRADDGQDRHASVLQAGAGPLDGPRINAALLQKRADVCLVDIRRQLAVQGVEGLLAA